MNLHQAELASKIKEKEREKVKEKKSLRAGGSVVMVSRHGQGAAVKRAQLVLAEQEAQMKMRTQREAHVNSL